MDLDLDVKSLLHQNHINDVIWNKKKSNYKNLKILANNSVAYLLLYNFQIEYMKPTTSRWKQTHTYDIFLSWKYDVFVRICCTIGKWLQYSVFSNSSSLSLSLSYHIIMKVSSIIFDHIIYHLHSMLFWCSRVLVRICKETVHYYTNR